MKLRKLDAKSVRSTAAAASLRLSAAALRDVTAGAQSFGTVDPETCAIHFNYPQDALA